MVGRVSKLAVTSVRLGGLWGLLPLPSLVERNNSAGEGSCLNPSEARIEDLSGKFRPGRKCANRAAEVLVGLDVTSDLARDLR